MITVNVQVNADELILRLDGFPLRLRAALHQKFEKIFDEVRTDFLKKTPGKYLDPRHIQFGIADQGSLVIGFIETEDKPGFYAIFPSKGRVLRFISKSGQVVFTRSVMRHPFLKGTRLIEEHLRAMKPWVIDQMEDALIEAL